jgi:phage shock protein B
MSVPAGLVAVLFLVVVAPIWIVAHYATRWRTARMMSKEQERVLADLWELAQGMEQRVENLESILDAEAPGWRGRAQAGAHAPGFDERWNHADPWVETRR